MIQIDISQNRQEARITVQAEKTNYPDIIEIRSAISAAGVIYGVDEAVLAEIVKKMEPVNQVVFARGKLATPGLDASVQWHVEEEFNQRPRITERDRADFKQLQLFEQVKKDQLLATKSAATAGEPGRTVTGDDSQIPGKDFPLPAGKNTYISEDGLNLYAQIDGYAFWSGGLLTIDNVYHVKGDVDYSTGNVKFNGAVVIDGDVRSGFRVEATDSIYIGGNVEAATIYAQKGDITVQFGILGRHKARLITGGTFNCGFIQDATVGAKSDVNIEHYAINSTISSGGKVTLIGKEGLIRGGNIIAEKGIEANEIGSDQSIFTELNITETTISKSSADMWSISKNRADLLMRLSSLEKRMSFIRLLKNGTAQLSQEKKDEQKFVENEIARLKEKIKELDNSEVDLQKKAARVTITKEVVVTGVLHPNVQLNIGGTNYFFDNPIEGVRIYRFRDEIIIESLNEVEDESYDIFIPQQD